MQGVNEEKDAEIAFDVEADRRELAQLRARWDAGERLTKDELRRFFDLVTFARSGEL